MKIEPVTYIWMFEYAMKFELPEEQKVKFWDIEQGYRSLWRTQLKDA